MHTSSDIDAGLARLRHREGQLLEAAGVVLRAGNGPFLPSHFLVIGTAKKAIAVQSGFSRLIEERNLMCAGALLRLHVDTVARFSALWLVADAELFAGQVIKRARVDRLKDRSGARLTDRHLVKKLAEQLHWVESVYDVTSGFVHLSHEHILAAFRGTQENDEALRIEIGAHDPHVSESSFVEAIEAFEHLTSILQDMFGHWANRVREISKA